MTEIPQTNRTLGFLGKTLQRLLSHTKCSLKGSTFAVLLNRKLLRLSLTTPDWPLCQPIPPLIGPPSVLLQGVNPGDTRHTGTVVFLPDPADVQAG